MYLEISSRQTGKTERLLKNFCECHNRGQRVALFAHNQAWSRELERHIYDVYCVRTKVFASIAEFERAIRGTEFNKPQDYTLFYDEFDFMDPRNVWVQENGYYATTPKAHRSVEDIIRNKFLRDDPLLTLLEMNNGRYESVSAMTNMSLDRMLDNHRSASKEQIDLEYCINFIKY